MPNIERFSIALTPELAVMVRNAVETGEFASCSEVIREALQEWNRKRSRQKSETDQIKRLWREGLESGPGRYADMKAIKAEARHRSRS